MLSRVLLSAFACVDLVHENHLDVFTGHFLHLGGQRLSRGEEREA